MPTLMPSVLLAAIDWQHVREQFLLLLPLLVPLTLGALSLYLLLPRPKPYPTLWGVFSGAAALVLGGMWIIRAGVIGIENALFYLFALGAVVSGVLLVTQSNPARGALCFTLVVLSTCGLFLLLAAPFLMAATIIIYAGAIVVTFLFVLMLASQVGFNDADSRSREPAFAVITGMVLLAAILYVLKLGNDTDLQHPVDAPTKEGTQKITGDEALASLIQRARTAREKETYADLKKEVYGLDHPSMQNDLFGRTVRALRQLQLISYRPQVAALEERLTKASPEQLVEARLALEAFEKLLEFARLDLRQRAGLLYLNPGTEQEDGSIATTPTTSGYSGTSASVSPAEVRRDAQGRPQMPADNSGYLGRSLFTDYLVPVELGGLLLLIATIGAIAIAYRHQTPGRAS